MTEHDVGWLPARGSYEEAVLSWQEQTDRSHGRRQQEAQRPGSEPSPRQDTAPRSAGNGG